MANPPGSFIWFELMTTDANAAARFYGSVVGWNIPLAGDPNGPPGRDYRMILRDDGGSAGGVMQLSPEMIAGGARSGWFPYLYVSDVDAATKAIVEDGGRVHLPKMSLPVGDIAMVSDPMGTALYVMRPVPPPGKPDAASDVFDPKATQRVRWNELQTPDLDRAKAFYAKHFAFEFRETMPMGEFGDYCFVDHGGLRVGGMMKKAHPGPAAWVAYFGVPSATAAKKAIEAGGGAIVMDVHEVPGGDWVVIATDPQGAAFGVVGPKGE